MKPNLTPRAVAALSTSAVSLFLFLCFAGYGGAEASDATGSAGVTDTVASWFVGPLGAGAHVLALSGLAWGVIVYFQERTGDLVLRLGSTVTLAASTAMLFGLAHGDGRSMWAGSLGTAGARLFGSLGGLGTALGSLAAIALFGVSLVFATDWLFHTLRRGQRKVFDPRNLPTEPARADLLDDPTDVEPREFVRTESRISTIVEQLPASEPAAPAVRTDRLPEGFEAETTDGRTLLRGPSGYEGVEFLTPVDELAIPQEVDPTPIAPQFLSIVDDEWSVGALPDPFADDDPLEVAAEERAAETTEETTSAEAEVEEEPLAAEPDEPAEIAAEETEDEEPASGIAFADASMLLDDEIAVPATFGVSLGLPNDGASTAHEIANAYEDLDAAPARAAAAPAPEAPAEPTPASVAETPVPAEDASDDEAPGFAFEDDVLVDPGVVLADEMIVVDEAMPFAPEPAARTAGATLSEPESGISYAPGVDAVAAEAQAPAVGEVALPAARLPEPDTEEIFATDDAVEVAEETVAEVADGAAAVAPEAAAEVEVEEAVAEAAPTEAEESFAGEETVYDPFAATDDELDFGESFPEPMAVPEAVLHPAPVAETAEEAAEETVAETVAEVEAAPVVEAEPVATFVGTPSAVEETVVPPAEEPARTPEPEDETAETEAAKEQLRLFPPPACDFSALASMELDPLFHDAVTAILARDRASAVVLQRALGIGYARGLRILDQMTDAGMLGPDSPGGAREILFTEAQWRARS